MPLELEFPGYCEQPNLGARNQTQVHRESYTPVRPEAFFFLALGFVQLRVVFVKETLSERRRGRHRILGMQHSLEIGSPVLKSLCTSANSSVKNGFMQTEVDNPSQTHRGRLDRGQWRPFPSFPLHPKAQPHGELDVSRIRRKTGEHTSSLAWNKAQ